MSRFEDAIPVILKHEGGFCDDACDPGGATNFGVSLRFLRELPLSEGDIDHDGDIDAADVRGMSRENAAAIYRAEFWDRLGYGAIKDQAVATKIFDMAVNMGGKQAHKLVQRALNVCGVYCAVDGMLGPKTLDAINFAQPELLLAQIRSECEKFYRRLVDLRPKLKKFLNGWLVRANS